MKLARLPDPIDIQHSVGGGSTSKKVNHAASGPRELRFFPAGDVCVAAYTGDEHRLDAALVSLRQEMKRTGASYATLILPASHVQAYATLDRAALASVGVAVQLAKTKDIAREARELAQDIEQDVADAIKHFGHVAP